jgi:hypothetical protein
MKYPSKASLSRAPGYIGPQFAEKIRELALRMRCSRCGRKANEVVANSIQRPRGDSRGRSLQFSKARIQLHHMCATPVSEPA